MNAPRKAATHRMQNQRRHPGLPRQAWAALWQMPTSGIRFDAPDALAGARRPRASEQDNEQFLKRKIDIFSLTFSPELGLGELADGELARLISSPATRKKKSAAKLSLSNLGQCRFACGRLGPWRVMDGHDAAGKPSPERVRAAELPDTPPTVGLASLASSRSGSRKASVSVVWGSLTQDELEAAAPPPLQCTRVNSSKKGVGFRTDVLVYRYDPVCVLRAVAGGDAKASPRQQRPPHATPGPRIVYPTEVKKLTGNFDHTNIPETTEGLEEFLRESQELFVRKINRRGREIQQSIDETSNRSADTEGDAKRAASTAEGGRVESTGDAPEVPAAAGTSSGKTPSLSDEGKRAMLHERLWLRRHRKPLCRSGYKQPISVTEQDWQVFSDAWRVILDYKHRTRLSSLFHGIVHGEKVHFCSCVSGASRANVIKMRTAEFCSALAQARPSGQGAGLKNVPEQLRNILILKRGSTLKEILSLSFRNLEHGKYQNAYVEYVYSSLSPELRGKTDFEWDCARRKYKVSVVASPSSASSEDPQAKARPVRSNSSSLDFKVSDAHSRLRSLPRDVGKQGDESETMRGARSKSEGNAASFAEAQNSEMQGGGDVCARERRLKVLEASLRPNQYLRKLADHERRHWDKLMRTRDGANQTRPKPAKQVRQKSSGGGMYRLRM